MKRLPNRLPLVAALLGTAFACVPAGAEDIDLYAGTAGGVAAPNVLFFLDNSSNWSANSQAWSKTTVYNKCASNYSGSNVTICQNYVNQLFGSDNSLVQGQVELRALKLVLNEAVCSATGSKLTINAGLMMFNTQGTVDGNSVISGYMRHRISPMEAQCTETDVTKSIVADLTNIDQKITTPDFKGPSSAEYGAPLYEAFKYFGGYTRPSLVSANTITAGTPTDSTHFGPIRYSKPTSLEDAGAFTDGSKTTYLSPISSEGACGNNYIILIGNTWPNQEYGTNTNASPDPTNTLMTRLGYSAGAQLYPSPLTNSDKTNVRFADEWAKFLYDTDVSSAAGKQNVRTFTIDVYNASQDQKQKALLQSMAKYGQGGNDYSGYFSVGGDLLKLINALKDVLTTIAGNNSMFTSASLPVSVNAQGTFLNQVYMGVFRPDDKARQRWMGNLKQYRFAIQNSSLYLADSTVDSTGQPKAAVDTANTGFIQNCAVSYWTTDSGTYWQSINGTTSDCSTSTTSKYSDSPDGPIVERGGAAQRLRNKTPANRNIRTCKTLDCRSSGNYALFDFNATNVTIPSGLSSGTTSSTLVSWIRGENNGDGAPDASGVVSYTTYATAGLTASSTRPTVHGEVVHSRPLAMNYGTGTTSDIVVFYGSGDGMLHAIDGSQSTTSGGDELWAFVAPEHWSGTVTDTTNNITWNVLDRVRTDSPLISFPNVATTLSPKPYPKSYFFDGSIGAYQERTSAGISKLWIYPTMRRGGRAVYAFDVTRRPSTTDQPQLLWKFGSDDNSAMGQSWSTPVAIRVQGRSTPLAVFGAGYDTCEDSEDSNTACASSSMGRGIFVMNAKDGSSVSSDYRFIGVGSGLDSTAGRFVADVATVDVNGDGYIDAIYAVDTRGNIWRINTSDPTNNYQGYSNLSDWPVQKIAVVSQWGTVSLTERRKFMYAPSLVALGSQVTVLIGTGDREKPSSTSNSAQVKNRFYGIRDDIAILPTTVDATTGVMGVTPVVGYGPAAVGTNLPELMNVTNKSPLSDAEMATLATYRGWFLDLITTSPPYEQVVTRPLTIAGTTYFSTYQAKSAATDGEQVCVGLGTGRGYQIDFQTGTQLANRSLVTEFLGGGMPPSPIGGLVNVAVTSSDGTTTTEQTVPFCMGCGSTTTTSEQVTQGGSTNAPQKLKITVKPNRKPVYRYQRIDK